MPKAAEAHIQAVYIDGENISKIDVACLYGRFPVDAVKFIYQSKNVAKKRGYPGFEHVIVPNIGKESVDKVIGMDIVAGYFSGFRHFAIVSNDHDFGATALHLIDRYPDAHMHIICDPARVSGKFVAEMKNGGISVSSISESDALDEFACRVVEVIHDLYHAGRLTLPRLGVELRNRGVSYENLKKDLIHHKIIDPCGKGGDAKLYITDPSNLGGDVKLSNAVCEKLGVGDRPGVENNHGPE